MKWKFSRCIICVCLFACIYPQSHKETVAGILSKQVAAVGGSGVALKYWKLLCFFFVFVFLLLLLFRLSSSVLEWIKLNLDYDDQICGNSSD